MRMIRDGEPFWCKFVGRAVDPAVPSRGAIWIFEDISVQRRQEEELRSAKNQAEDATRLKDKFVALVSHDLRAPMGNIIGMLNLVKDDRALDPKIRLNLLDKLSDNAEALLKLIDKLLDLSRLQTGAMRPSKRFFPARNAVDGAIARVSFLATQKGVAVENKVPEEKRLLADPDLFGEVIFNLLSNAVKFTRPGDKITVEGSSEGNTMVVRDTGIGISPKLLPDLFKSEVKTTSLGTSGETGSGLGLPYCQEIMRAHGGELSVESEAGKGTAFTLALRNFDHIVLIVDDQEAHRVMMKEIIGSAVAADFLEADNGTEALSIMMDVIPSLVITDINMAGMDGFTFLAKMRANPSWAGVRVVVATSLESSQTSEREARRKAESLGAAGFVIKPVVTGEFLPLITKLLPPAE
jgi:CheY-like chemotaxis protein/nitrogen-specific signal transduction histidine kinase